MSLGYVALACQVTLAGTFLFSLVSKVRSRKEYEEFVASVIVLRLVRSRLARVLAAATVVAEAATFGLLAVPWTVPAGFLAAAALLVAFTAAISIALRRGSRAPCRCFGASSTPIGWSQIARSLVLLAGCGTGLVGGRPAWSQLDLAWTVISLVVAAVALLFVRRLDDLVSLFTAPTASRPASSNEQN